MTKRLQYLVVSLSTVLLAVLMLGLMMGRTNAADASGPAYRHFDVLTEVISKIKSDYVEEPNMHNVTLGAVNGLLESIDPYASYLSPDQYKQYLKSREATRAGVGLIVSRRFGYVSVVDAIPGSPADKLELTTGDVIESINNVGTRDMPLAYAEMLLQGEAGTTLELSVIRVRKSAEATKIQLTREMVAMPPVTARMLSADIGYVKAASLEAGKVAQIAAKVKELAGQGAQKLVLDVRNNAAGAPLDGLELANLFLDKGTLAASQGQKVQRQTVTADAAKMIWSKPVVVLANRGTSGGAELAATAILDNKRGEVVGERTYGDAAIRKALTMEDGSAVILAVAKFYNAAGKKIQDEGVAPTLTVIDPNGGDDDADDDAPKAPAATPQPAEKPAEDIQLKKAVEVLTSGLEAAKKSDPKIAAQNPDAKPGPDGLKDVVPTTQPGTLGVPRKQ